MAQENMVLEYSIMGLPTPNGHKIRLYEDGKVEEVGVGMDFKKMENVNGKILRETQVPPEQVQSYAERLVEANFFDYHPFQSFVFDGLVETMTLNYQRRSRTIDSGNQTSRTLFPEIVRELEALVEQPE